MGADENFRVKTWGAKAAALSNGYKVVCDRYFYLDIFPFVQGKKHCINLFLAQDKYINMPHSCSDLS